MVIGYCKRSFCGTNKDSEHNREIDEEKYLKVCSNCDHLFKK